mmetsp:Transcript_32539/g.81934  ORF Transcript_32539/g.81934 Transcript_32539/m.81934 type:complete len:89 (-) Transcript_32539:284-550(-)
MLPMGSAEPWNDTTAKRPSAHTTAAHALRTVLSDERDDPTAGAGSLSSGVCSVREYTILPDAIKEAEGTRRVLLLLRAREVAEDHPRR